MASPDGVWATSHDPDEMLDLIDSVPGLSIDLRALTFVLVYAVRRVEHLTDTPQIGFGIVPDEKKPFLEVNGEAYHIVQGAKNLLAWARIQEINQAKRHCQALFVVGSPEHTAAHHSLLSWIDANSRATVAHMLRREMGNPFVPKAKPEPAAPEGAN